MNNSTLLMIGILAGVAMLSAALVVPIQQASAQDTEFTFKQKQSNKCSGSATCTNTGTIAFGAVVCYICAGDVR
jgi:hypothetical protein